MKALVTGGAGYVGSVVAAQLLDAGHEVVVLDDLSRGHREAIAPGADHLQLSLNDAHALEERLGGGFDAVLHFAALCSSRESGDDPEQYYRNNVGGTLTLLDAMRADGVAGSSSPRTCATYGEPETVPITEDLPQAPVNPYGATKLVVDRDDARLLRRLRPRRAGAALLQRRGARPTARSARTTTPRRT